MVKRFTPINAHVGPKTVNDNMSDNYALAVMDVKDQFKALLKEYYRWADHMDDQSGEVLIEALTPTFQMSQYLVPKDTHALLESGYLEKRQSRGRTQVEIGYGRRGSPSYAILQHENLEFHHAEPTTAKFLERPLLQNADAIREAVIKGMKEASGV